MSQHFFYCSELARRFAEKTYGTASTGDVWLLIEYPYSWATKAIQDSTLSPTVKAYLNKIIKTNPRAKILFIKRDRAYREELTIFLVRCRERNPSIVRFNVSSYEQLLDLNLTAVGTSELLQGGTIFERPLYLVCTHGKRDKCCAKFGYPLYKALTPYAGDGVWQSSHVGGDRFAANLVCFPHGLFYAHVMEEAGKAIIEQYEQRRLVLNNYRGRACYSYPVQAAEFFVRSESGLTGLDDLRYSSYERVNENAWRVRFATPDEATVYEAKVVRVLSEFASYHTCHSTEEKPVVQYSLDDYRMISDRSLSRG